MGMVYFLIVVVVGVGAIMWVMNRSKSETDLAMKQRNGAVFAVDAETLEDPDTHARLAELKISPTGPIWGSSMTTASGATGEIERNALAETGVTLDHFTAFEARTRQPIAGARRTLRAPMTGPHVESGTDEHGPFVRCRFDLPKGAFATEVMREVMSGPDSQSKDGHAHN